MAGPADQSLDRGDFTPDSRAADVEGSAGISRAGPLRAPVRSPEPPSPVKAAGEDAGLSLARPEPHPGPAPGNGTPAAVADDAPPQEAIPVDVQVNNRLLDFAFRNMVLSMVTDLICLVTVGFMIWAPETATTLGAWLGLAGLHLVARALTVRAYYRTSIERRRAMVWRRAFFYSSVTMAALWGLAGALFIPAVAPDLRVFLIALMLGVSAATMLAVAPQPATAYTSYAFMGFPIAVAFFASEQSTYQALGLLCVVYTVFMAVMARSVHGLLEGSVRAGLEKSALADRLEQARARAERANDAKSRFLANMSHELRTPLNAINGFSEMMKAGRLQPNEPAAYQEYASIIHSSGTHLLDLINDILDLAKAEAGTHELVEETVELAGLAAECAAVIRGSAAAAGVRIQSAISTADGRAGPQLRADRRKLRQILLNLLSNAIKFTPAGGQVTIAAEVEMDGGLTLLVRDTGVGMSRDQLDAAMKPFTQVDDGYDKRYQGTGLGLPLTKTLIELHGGTLRVDSEKGHGTTARVWMPPVRTLLSARAMEPAH